MTGKLETREVLLGQSHCSRARRFVAMVRWTHRPSKHMKIVSYNFRHGGRKSAGNAWQQIHEELSADLVLAQETFHPADYETAVRRCPNDASGGLRPIDWGSAIFCMARGAAIHSGKRATAGIHATEPEDSFRIGLTLEGTWTFLERLGAQIVERLPTARWPTSQIFLPGQEKMQISTPAEISVESMLSMAHHACDQSGREAVTVAKMQGISVSL